MPIVYKLLKGVGAELLKGEGRQGHRKLLGTCRFSRRAPHRTTFGGTFRENDGGARAGLEVGEMVVIDNHRVCHGRTAFTGFRNLVGCYVGRDDWESSLRVLDAQQG